ncbi:hypothetical protein PQ455_05250 [Sphingomonas naphthae]|uniref:Spermidine synthase n=1 Tax=Sphingomonas naphthae TaxID=1813468 RepID=A0ABY7TR23_9SPHN|nr:hypothetical protein [Sphingomonas naphthae]WCT74639.1 hypothetical protein PQ455_05250 [Sphingomonas naphthae]
MTPLELLDTADLPGGGTLRLMTRHGDYMILLGRNELMSSRLSGSEEALARLACEKIRGRPRPRMLIGGLGMGFTLRQALADLPKDAAVTVAELVPKVVEWAKGPLAHLAGASLADRRVTVEVGDVQSPIARGPGQWDAILLDVDNGPDGLTIPSNDRLYGKEGLRAAYDALAVGGVLAIWSAGADKAFTERLRRARFVVEEVPVRATGGRKGAHHMIWVAVKR